jgi:aldehyde dehydrogenase (NAD+)
MKSLIAEQNEFFNSHVTKDIDFRIQALNDLKRAILEYEDKISSALYEDLGKSKVEAYSTEIGFSLHEISTIIKNLKKWSKPKKVKNHWVFPLSKSYIHKEPYGRVLIISPWNYPFSLAISPLAGAISDGN